MVGHQRNGPHCHISCTQYCKYTFPASFYFSSLPAPAYSRKSDLCLSLLTRCSQTGSNLFLSNPVSYYYCTSGRQVLPSRRMPVAYRAIRREESWGFVLFDSLSTHDIHSGYLRSLPSSSIESKRRRLMRIGPRTLTPSGLSLHNHAPHYS